MILNQKSLTELALSKSPNLAILFVDKDGKIRFINKQFEKIFDLKPKYFFKKDFEQLFTQIHDFYQIKELLNDNTKLLKERVIKQNDSYFRLNISNVLKNSKEFDGFIITAVDVTHEKELEEEKIRHEQMLNLNAKMATMGEMVSAISHQQRSPLSAIMLSLDQIDDAINANDNQAIYENLEIAKRAVKLMNETIESFARFYKNDESVRSVDLARLIRELEFIVRSKLNQHGIDLNIQIDRDKKFIINSIGGYIKQILLSLITNSKDELINVAGSLKDMPQITIRLFKTDDEFCISVADNGFGIDDESKIFDPFFTTKQNSGTGMGLYMARSLADKNLNARLVLKSKKDPTEFCLYLKDSK